ncbi:MAG: hypothetical protein EPO29_10590 [Betaproteobacteria bacterium]|nr:MAG: hypothetical protein EPO29_10590 [Betaproteobacteria bacterium]
MTTRKRMLAALTVAALSLSGCYVLPVAPDGYVYPYPPAAVLPPPPAYPAPSPAGPMPTMLQARLYPANDIAKQTGVVTGTVTNMMTGKGRFQLDYRGETLTGEATRVDGDSRRGVASAYGPSGTFMSCEYQMNTPRQGAGTCAFSNGARYQVHVGS